MADDESRLKDMAQRLYEHDEFGALHIVVADGNLEDAHIQSCLDDPCEPLTDSDRALARDLLAMTEADREAAYDLAFNAW